MGWPDEAGAAAGARGAGRRAATAGGCVTGATGTGAAGTWAAGAEGLAKVAPQFVQNCIPSFKGVPAFSAELSHRKFLLFGIALRGSRQPDFSTQIQEAKGRALPEPAHRIQPTVPSGGQTLGATERSHGGRAIRAGLIQVLTYAGTLAARISCHGRLARARARPGRPWHVFACGFAGMYTLKLATL